MTLTGNLEQKFKKSLYPRIRPGPSQAEHLSEADLFVANNILNLRKMCFYCLSRGKSDNTTNHKRGKEAKKGGIFVEFRIFFRYSGIS